LALTAFMLIVNINHTLNDIWHEGSKESKESKGGIMRKLGQLLLHWLILLLIPLFFGCSILLSALLLSGLTILNPIIVFATGFLLNVLTFSFIYIVVPIQKVRWQDGCLGGILVSTLFSLGKAGFSAFINHFSTYNFIYGAFAIVPLFLIWLYVA